MRSPAEIVAAVVRPEIRALSAYAVARADGMIKLDAMEVPYRLPPEVAREGRRRRRRGAGQPLSRTAAPRACKTALRDAFGIPESLGLILGNGSDELLQIVTIAVARPGVTMLAPEPSFVMYRMNALYAGVRFVGVPLAAGLRARHGGHARRDRAGAAGARLSRVSEQSDGQSLRRGRRRGHPARRAGDWSSSTRRTTRTRVRASCRASPSFRTSSSCGPSRRSGWRGCGWATPSRRPEWTTELNKVRQPYNLNALTQAVAPVLLAERALLAEQAARIKSERSRLGAAFAVLAGVASFPTQTNFVLARVPDAPRWFERLRDAGILVKNLHGWHPSARALPAGHRRHAGRERRRDRGAENDTIGHPMPKPRTAKVERNTNETQIAVEVNLDGEGRAELATGVPFLDHMLDQLARHGMIDLIVRAAGDLHIDAHHTVEDIGITLGQAVAKALGDKRGLVRYGHAYVPLDEALSRVVIDLSGRPGLEFHVPFVRAMIGAFDVDLAHEFFQGFVNHALVTLHVDNLRGQNAHHQAETVFKAFARALRMAVARDPRGGGRRAVDQRDAVVDTSAGGRRQRG